MDVILYLDIDLSNFNTNNVTNMRSMFDGCYSLVYIDLTNFNTNKVTNMSTMFFGCALLEELNISNFDINKETNMKYMFSDCSEKLKNNIRVQLKNIKEEAFLNI